MTSSLVTQELLTFCEPVTWDPVLDFETSRDLSQNDQLVAFYLLAVKEIFGSKEVSDYRRMFDVLKHLNDRLVGRVLQLRIKELGDSALLPFVAAHYQEKDELQMELFARLSQHPAALFSVNKDGETALRVWYGRWMRAHAGRKPSELVLAKIRALSGSAVSESAWNAYVRISFPEVSM